MPQEQMKYAKRLVFQKREEAKAFLDTYMEVDVSRHFRLSVAPLVREIPLVGKVLFQDVRLEPVSDMSCVRAMCMRLLDASLLDGMLRRWKGNLVQLEDCAPMA